MNKQTEPKPKPSRKKVIASDISGVILILASGAIGWLPGPGGLPLFFAGLTLLAANHEKPQRLLDYFKSQGFRIVEIMFPNDKQIEKLWDVFAVFSFLFGTNILINYNSTRLLVPIGVSYTVWAVLSLYYNRQRGEALKSLFKNKPQY